MLPARGWRGELPALLWSVAIGVGATKCRCSGAQNQKGRYILAGAQPANCGKNWALEILTAPVEETPWGLMLPQIPLVVDLEGEPLERACEAV